MALESLFLFRDIKMVSPLTVDEARMALEARLYFHAPGDHDHRFGGRLTGDGFSIMRRAQMANNMRPLVQGKFRAEASGTQVRAAARLPLGTAAFILLVLGLSTYVTLTYALESFSRGQYVGMLGLLVPLFGSLVVYVPFALEVGHAERFLRTTLKAERARL